MCRTLSRLILSIYLFIYSNRSWPHFLFLNCCQQLSYRFSNYVRKQLGEFQLTISVLMLNFSSDREVRSVLCVVFRYGWFQSGLRIWETEWMENFTKRGVFLMTKINTLGLLWTKSIMDCSQISTIKWVLCNLKLE